MPRSRTEVEQAIGRLIVVVQREWTDAMGEPGVAVSEEVLHNCHALLVAAKHGRLEQEMQGRSVAEILGLSWVRLHPGVVPAVKELETAISRERHA